MAAQSPGQNHTACETGIATEVLHGCQKDRPKSSLRNGCAGMSWGLILCCEFVTFLGVLPWHSVVLVCSLLPWLAVLASPQGWVYPSLGSIFLWSCSSMGICSTLQQSCSLCCLGCQHSSGLAPAGDFGSCWGFWLLPGCAEPVWGLFCLGSCPQHHAGSSTGMQSQDPSSQRPSPALWQSLSCQKLLEETQILHFSQALGQS